MTTTTAAPAPVEPDSRMTRRARPSWVADAVVTAFAFLLALVLGGVLVVVSSEEVTSAFGYFFSRPQDALLGSLQVVGATYGALLRGSLGGPTQISQTLLEATPLICAGLSVSLAFRAGLFNIGAQGQLIMGALAAGLVGFGVTLPPVLHLVAAVVAGVLAGALWGGIAGALKARTGAHEVITTIMLNYVALNILVWLLNTDLLQRPGSNDPVSPSVDETAQFPQVFGTRLHLGFLLALAAAAGVWWLLARTTTGFEFRAVGANSSAARTAGMSVARGYTLVMVLAGALAGVAGVMQVSGRDLPLTDGIAATIGFDAITVALLGRATPLGTVLAGLLFGALQAGSRTMQLETGTPLTLVTVLQALIVLFIAAPALVRAVVRWRALRGTGGGEVLAKGWNG